MKLKGSNSYSREWYIGENCWKLKFVKKIDDTDPYGLCDPSDHTMYIKQGLDKFEILKTAYHEFLHAAEHEYNFDLDHRHVHKLEDAFGEFLLNNWDALEKIFKD